MFGWFKWGKPVHPLADVRSAQELIAGLPAQDPARALDTVAAQLDSITGARAIDLRQRWNVIDLLDRGTVAHRRKLAQDLAAPRLKKVDGERMWTASFGFWKSLGAAYQRCIETAKARPTAVKSVRKYLPLIAARALHASDRQLRLTYSRHGQVEERIWRELGSAYLFAESQGFAALRVELYPEPRSQSSAQEELLKSLMLATASPWNLADSKLRIAERVVAHFGGRFVLCAEPMPECGFYFDLAQANPPGRRRQMAAGPTVRYFGAGEAERGLADLMREVRARDGVPSDVNLGGHFDRDTVISVLAYLSRLWDTAAPERSGERAELVTRVTVVPGFPNILRCLELLAGGATPDRASFAEKENWIAVDRSEGGYGLLVPKERNSFDYDPLTGARTGSGDWLRIGSLVALGEEHATTWKLGIVRGIRHEASGQRHVGIEVLKGLAIIIRLAAASGPRAGVPERRRSAVLLSSAADKNDEALVLMRAGHFMKTQSLNADLGGRRYLLLPSELLESGEDFDCARFKVVPA